MAALHAALKSLGPVNFADVPTDTAELNDYISDLFTQSQLILESIPIVEPITKDTDSSTPTIASSAAEIKPSTARSATPIEEHVSLQKEWGKPIKLGAKENALGMSVYKTSGKDGKGAWFARRSVHEGLGFSRFKSSMEQEFEQSLAVQGTPGEGNVRGIGGEERVESIEVPGKGKVEVYRLSAQFPGPTTPRDFVTLLVTSNSAMKAGNEPGGIIPRHYMVISKPCNHPDTQPQNGFIRGSYESVEFIREVPRKLKASMSTTNLEVSTSHDGDEDIGKTATIRNAQQKAGDALIGNRRQTEPQQPLKSITAAGDTDDEQNPVEWIMVTRSDPGGSVPRFMVERGTPSSICQDASKFLDWACQQDDAEEDIVKDQTESIPDAPRRPSVRRDSFQSFRSSRLAGLEGSPAQNGSAIDMDDGSKTPTKDDHTTSGGFMGAVVGAVSAYTPQVVLDHLPGQTAAAVTGSDHGDEKQSEDDADNADDADDAEDAKSILSTTSFQSAEDHLSSDEADAQSQLSKTSLSKDRGEDDKLHSQHEKELDRLKEKHIALESKFADSRSKLDAQVVESAAKEETAHKKALEKHEKEVKKHEEKYRKEMQKLEERQRKERAKLEEKSKKQQDKNEQGRLRRERDDARRDAELARKETESLRAVVADLQRENTALVAKLGNVAGVKAVDEVQADIAGHVPRRSGSSRRKTVGSSHSNLSEVSGIEQGKGAESASIKSEKS